MSGQTFLTIGIWAAQMIVILTTVRSTFLWKTNKKVYPEGLVRVYTFHYPRNLDVFFLLRFVSIFPYLVQWLHLQPQHAPDDVLVVPPADGSLAEPLVGVHEGPGLA